jgi:NADH-quinone oxidoreductase subunit D
VRRFVGLADQSDDITAMLAHAPLLIRGLLQGCEAEKAELKEYIATMKKRIAEYDALLTKNPIWMDRTIGIGVMTVEQCYAMNVTGACARGCGVDWDLRRDMPYAVYPELQFDVPVRKEGDVYARYLVRLEEMRQSVRILEQAINKLPSGPVNVDNYKIVLPPKALVKTDMEAMIHHFKLTIDGCKPPAGEVYVGTESPRGELGFYIISDGSGKPYRMKVRNPTLINLQSLDMLCKGHYLADIVSVIGTLDVVLGEVDK